MCSHCVGYHRPAAPRSRFGETPPPYPPRPELTATDIDLSRRVVLITGATGGLGRELAIGCAARGATVVLHARVVPKLEQLYDEIVAAGYPQPTILPLDLAEANPSDFGNVAIAIQAQLGRLDGLVHTAAFLGSLGPIEHQAFGAWQKVMRVNLVAAMALTRSTLPLLSAAPDASVVFTLDTRANDPRAYWGAYAASKAGLLALATTLADECEGRANLRINAVVPGPIRTPLRMLTHPGEDRATLPRPEDAGPVVPASSRRPVEGRKWCAHRRSRVARGSACVGSTHYRFNGFAGRTAVTKHDAEAPKFVRGQRVRQEQHCARRLPPAIAVCAPDERRQRRADIGRFKDRAFARSSRSIGHRDATVYPDMQQRGNPATGASPQARHQHGDYDRGAGERHRHRQAQRGDERRGCDAHDEDRRASDAGWTRLDT